MLSNRKTKQNEDFHTNFCYAYSYKKALKIVSFLHSKW